MVRLASWSGGVHDERAPRGLLVLVLCSAVLLCASQASAQTETLQALLETRGEEPPKQICIVAKSFGPNLAELDTAPDVAMANTTLPQCYQEPDLTIKAATSPPTGKKPSDKKPLANISATTEPTAKRPLRCIKVNTREGPQDQRGPIEALLDRTLFLAVDAVVTDVEYHGASLTVDMLRGTARSGPVSVSVQGGSYLDTARPIRLRTGNVHDVTLPLTPKCFVRPVTMPSVEASVTGSLVLDGPIAWFAQRTPDAQPATPTQPDPSHAAFLVIPAATRVISARWVRTTPAQEDVHRFVHEWVGEEPPAHITPTPRTIRFQWKRHPLFGGARECPRAALEGAAECTALDSDACPCEYTCNVTGTLPYRVHFEYDDPDRLAWSDTLQTAGEQLSSYLAPKDRWLTIRPTSSQWSASKSEDIETLELSAPDGTKARVPAPVPCSNEDQDNHRCKLTRVPIAHHEGDLFTYRYVGRARSYKEEQEPIRGGELSIKTPTLAQLATTLGLGLSFSAGPQWMLGPELPREEAAGFYAESQLFASYRYKVRGKRRRSGAARVLDEVDANVRGGVSYSKTLFCDEFSENADAEACHGSSSDLQSWSKVSVWHFPVEIGTALFFKTFKFVLELSAGWAGMRHVRSADADKVESQYDLITSRVAVGYQVMPGARLSLQLRQYYRERYSVFITDSYGVYDEGTRRAHTIMPAVSLIFEDVWGIW